MCYDSTSLHQATWYHAIECSTFHSHIWENFKYKYSLLFFWMLFWRADFLVESSLLHGLLRDVSCACGMSMENCRQQRFNADNIFRVRIYVPTILAYDRDWARHILKCFSTVMIDTKRQTTKEFLSRPEISRILAFTRFCWNRNWQASIQLTGQCPTDKPVYNWQSQCTTDRPVSNWQASDQPHISNTTCLTIVLTAEHVSVVMKHFTPCCWEPQRISLL